jgi:hypothetical protein
MYIFTRLWSLVAEIYVCKGDYSTTDWHKGLKTMIRPNHFSVLSLISLLFVKIKYYCSQNLEVLVRRQHKARMYNNVKSGRHHLLFHGESALGSEMQHQKTINGDLICVLESLLTDFPTLKCPLTKILNTLQLKPA